MAKNTFGFAEDTAVISGTSSMLQCAIARLFTMQHNPKIDESFDLDTAAGLYLPGSDIF